MAKLAPVELKTFVDSNGNPYVGAKLFCYAANSSTKQNTYTDKNGSTPNSNPIILDANGSAGHVWLTDGLQYKFFLAASTDSDPPVGAALWQEDYVSGINDTSVSVDQWLASGLTPTYISATSFSFSGDQRSTFTVGRRIKSSNSGGTIYSTITSSTYASSVTTIVVHNDSGNLDSGLSSVWYGITSYTGTSQVATMNVAPCSVSTANDLDYTLTQIGDFFIPSYTDGLTLSFTTTSDNVAGSVTVNFNGLGTKSVLNTDASALRAGQFASGFESKITYVAGFGVFVCVNPVSGINIPAIRDAKRQAVCYGPVDSNGLPNLSGSTGGTTVTTSNISASDPLVVNSANGAYADYWGRSASNLSWTGLSTNGTMYLYVDIAATYGSLTTGSTTLQPIYQYGGTPSTTSGQCTFNTSQMKMFVGNGSAAVQTYRVFVGEVTVAAGVVSAITWYSYNGRYESAWTDTLPSAAALTTFNHNLGYAGASNYNSYGVEPNIVIRCKTADLNYSVGDLVYNLQGWNAANTYAHNYSLQSTRNATLWRAGVGAANACHLIQNATTGAAANTTDANWSYKLIAERTW